MTPTVGQIVWYYPAEHGADEQPLAAMVAYVVEEDVVNLAVFTATGSPLSPAPFEVPMVWDADVPDGCYCTPVGQSRQKEESRVPVAQRGPAPLPQRNQGSQVGKGSRLRQQGQTTGQGDLQSKGQGQIESKGPPGKEKEG
jgi:hypothetical protein